eukprot:UC4_evm6s1393
MSSSPDSASEHDMDGSLENPEEAFDMLTPLEANTKPYDPSSASTFNMSMELVHEGSDDDYSDTEMDESHSKGSTRPSSSLRSIRKTGGPTDNPTRYQCFATALGHGSYKTVYRGIDTEEMREIAWNELSIAPSNSNMGRTRTVDAADNEEEDDKSFSKLSSTTMTSQYDALSRKRAREEVKILQSINNRNIMMFLDYWESEEDRLAYFITELMTAGYLPLIEISFLLRVSQGWARNVLKGLQYLHTLETPIIHRDIKSDNIFVNPSSSDVKIGDLGLACLCPKGTKKHAIVGTPEFMAPEM